MPSVSVALPRSEYEALREDAASRGLSAPEQVNLWLSVWLERLRLDEIPEELPELGPAVGSIGRAQVSVPVDPETWRLLKLEAARRDIAVGRWLYWDVVRPRLPAAETETA